MKFEGIVSINRNTWRRLLTLIVAILLGTIIAYLVADSSFRLNKVILFIVLAMAGAIMSFHPEKLLYVIPLIIPLSMKVNHIFTFTTDTTTFILAYVTVQFSLNLLVKRASFSLKPVHVGLIGFGLVMWTSYEINGAPAQGFWEMICWTGGIILFIVIRSFIRRENDVIRMVIIGFGGSVFSSFLGIYQYVHGARGANITSTFWYYSDLADALAIFTVTILSFVMLGVPLGRRTKVILLALCMPNLFLLVISGSRGAWLGAGVGFLYLFIRVILRKRKKYIALFLVIIAAFTEMILHTPRLMTRLQMAFVLNEGSPHIRLLLWRDVCSIIQNHWLLGIGVGNLSSYLSLNQYYNPVFDSIAFYHAHNFYLQMILNGGVVALLFVVFLIFKLATGLISRNVSPVLAGLYAGALVFLSQNCFDYVIWDPANMYLMWMFLALIARVSSFECKKCMYQVSDDGEYRLNKAAVSN